MVCLRVCVALVVGIALVSETLAESPVEFNRDVRGILSDNCFQCHGPDANTREAGLRLDLRKAAIAERDGSIAIVPKHPEKSDLIARITSDDEFLQMPPPETGKQLSQEQIETLQRWIKEGATYQKHWSFEPIQANTPPKVSHEAWVRNPIDRFVLAQLEEAGIPPSQPADRYTLIRRVYLDFLGLPPSIAEVEEFVNDTRPDAYERLLDRVLANPHYGERWGRHWLDQARYADSHGYTNDNARVMWPYRDWVIDAFNRDLPFDQFTIEQLAGDLLPEPSLDQKIATGFHRNTLINTEGGTKADQFRDEQVKDRVDTTGLVWLGLTVGCAKCHDHKYDPISQQEYYQLYAFFNSTADRNSVPPAIKAPTPEQRTKLAELKAKIEALKQQLAADTQREARQRAWEQALVEKYQDTSEEESHSASEDWVIAELDPKSAKGATFTTLDDQSLLVSGKNLPKDEYKLTVRSPLTTVRSVRLEALTHPDLPKHGPGRAANGNFVLSEIWFRTGDGRELRFSKAHADHSQKRYDITDSIDNKSNTGWAINGAPEGGPNHNRTAWFVLPKPLEVEENHALTFTLQFDNNDSAYNLGRLRLALSSKEWKDQPSQQELATLASIPQRDRNKTQRERLEKAFLEADPQSRKIHSQLQSAQESEEKLLANVASTMIMQELDKPRETHVQIRGDFLRHGEKVKPDVPQVFPGLPEEVTYGNRLDFARWLMSANNPLVARVRVNRIWMRLFGRGLVETENDFGTQGSLPSHPELLDWLSAEFRQHGWSQKELLKLIANSATYRQASVHGGEGERRDPRNRLLSRQNRIRVEGEIVRDLGLAVSGLLSEKIGGPSVYPPQPDGVYAFTQRKKSWRTSRGEDRYRRGIYTFFYRSAPYPMLTTFDAPKFNQTCTRRDRSNTPLQALTVANAEAMVEIAQALAARVLHEEATTNERLTRMFRLCFARVPREREAEVLTHFYKSQQKRYQANPKLANRAISSSMPERVPQPEAAAWVAVARVLLNLDEFITRE